MLGVLNDIIASFGLSEYGNESKNLQQVEKQENGEERNISISNDETKQMLTHRK